MARKTNVYDPATGNALFYGDNLDVLAQHIPNESVDLVYLDPPFNSARNYSILFHDRSGKESQAQITAFDDTWTWSQESDAAYRRILDTATPAADAIEAMRGLVGTNDLLAYLVMMTERLMALHRVLKRTGSLWLHCDPTASHYLKVILDAIFGIRNFRNEVIWKRASTIKGNVGQGAKHFGPNTDTLLLYSRSDDYTFNQPFLDYSDDYLEKMYRYFEPDTGRRYRLISMIGPGGAAKGNPIYEVMGVTRYWRYSKAKMEELIAAGMVVQTKPGTVPQRKQYLDEGKGVAVQSLWTDIGNLQASSTERLPYATQKPVALLERVITTSSDPGDLVLDPFCGCGTAVDAAERLDRRWAGIDVSFLAVDLIAKRMRDTHPDAEFEMFGTPRDIEGASALFARNEFEFERWAVSLLGGTPNEKQVADKGKDGVIRFDKPGGKRGTVIISVKGGEHPAPTDARDLLGSLDAHNAELGVLILRRPATRGITEVANHSGSVDIEAWGSFPKIQVVTIEDLLQDKRPKLPSFIAHVAAKKHAPTPTTPTLW